MLLKRIDTASIPYGLAVAGEDIPKGSAVVIKLVAGVEKAFLPTTQQEADGVLGFAAMRISEVVGSDKDHDVIKSGSRLTVYTLVKNNMWGTTQFVGSFTGGESLVVDFAADKGKIRAITGAETTANRPVQFTVYNKETGVSGVQGYGYEQPILNVKVK